MIRTSSERFRESCEGFRLPEGIRPSPGSPWRPKPGYRVGRFLDRESGESVPMLVASVSTERLFEVFLELTRCLDDVVDVILETSHDAEDGRHKDLWRESIDRPVLLSHLWDYENLLVHDGCTGIAVLEPGSGREVQFDEHKLLFVYAEDLSPFVAVLENCGLSRDDRLKVVCETEHLHCTSEAYRQRFDELCCRLGVAEDAPALNG